MHAIDAFAKSRLSGIFHTRQRSWPTVSSSADAWLPGKLTRSPSAKPPGKSLPTFSTRPAAEYPLRKGNFQSGIAGSFSHWCVPVYTASSVPALIALYSAAIRIWFGAGSASSTSRTDVLNGSVMTA